jgi:outer membrane murein-binding lipoprotein Lpp
MSRITFGIIPAIVIIILSVFFYLIPQFFGPKAPNDKSVIVELVNKRIMNIGNFIARSTFVQDAIIEKDEAKLSEIIVALKQDEPEFFSVIFTDNKNKVIASSNVNQIGKDYAPLNPGSSSKIIEKSGIYEGGFSINLGTTTIGILYIQVKPRIPEIKAAPSLNPIILVAGIVMAIITFVIMVSITSGLESRLVDDINRRQEEVFQPKIEELKKQQAEAQKALEETLKKIAQGENKLKALEDEYQVRKKEFESSPVVQSVEKLRETESELLRKLEVLKTEENRLNNEINLLTLKREEIMNALEAEKKEEARLREKLDLIKKKILHLESPA